MKCGALSCPHSNRPVPSGVGTHHRVFSEAPGDTGGVSRGRHCRRICVSPLGPNVCQLKRHRVTLPGPTDSCPSPLAQVTEVTTQVPKGGDGGAQTQTLGFLTGGPVSLTEKIGLAPQVRNRRQGAPSPGQGPWVALVSQADFPLPHPEEGRRMPRPPGQQQPLSSCSSTLRLPREVTQGLSGLQGALPPAAPAGKRCGD